MAILNAEVEEIKVGDTLKCVADDTGPWWTKNKEYEIQRINGELCIFDGDDDLRTLRSVHTIDVTFELIKEETEMEKVVVPQFIADWFENNKGDLEFNIWDFIYEWRDHDMDEFKNWFDSCLNKPIETLIKMNLYGYEVEQEKRYYVQLVDDSCSYLNKDLSTGKVQMSTQLSTETYQTKFTEKEIKEINPLFFNEQFLKEVK